MSGEYNRADVHSLGTTVKDTAGLHESLPQHCMCFITSMATMSRLNYIVNRVII